METAFIILEGMRALPELKKQPSIIRRLDAKLNERKPLGLPSPTTPQLAIQLPDERHGYLKPKKHDFF
jgi:hypothetical protein